MKYLFTLVALFYVSIVFAGRPINEVLEYSIRFGILKGGKASISTVQKVEDGKTMILTEMKMQSTGLTHSFYNIDNTYSSFVNPTTCLPEKASCQIKEQDYRYSDEVIFNQEDSSLFSKQQGWLETGGDILDIVSLIYNFRFSDRLTKLRTGDLISIPFWDIDKIYSLQLKFTGIEEIKTRAGTFQCFKIEPVFEAGSAFSKQSPLSIWISHDDRKLPVLIKLNFKFGSVKCELEEF